MISEFLLGLVLIDLLLSDLEQAHHVLRRVLHEDVLTRLLLVLVDHIDHQLKDRPALSHAQIDLIAIHLGISAVGAENDVIIGVLEVSSGHEGEFHLVNACQKGLNDPS